MQMEELLNISDVATFQSNTSYWCEGTIDWSVFWDNGAKTLSDKLQRLQNHAVCVLTHFNYDADANQLLTELGWDNLETWRQKLNAEMVYKSLNGLAPNYLSSKFILRSDMITFYNFRDSDNKLAIPLPHTISKIALSIVVQSSGTVYPQPLGKQHPWLISDDC